MKYNNVYANMTKNQKTYRSMNMTNISRKAHYIVTYLKVKVLQMEKMHSHI